MYRGAKGEERGGEGRREREGGRKGGREKKRINHTIKSTYTLT